MRDFTDKVPTPEGHSVAHAMMGFDEDGDLLIVQCNEHWKPYEYDNSEQLFFSAVQRFVYYRKTEERVPETVTHFIVNGDNSVSLYKPVQQAAVMNLSPFLKEDFECGGIDKGGEEEVYLMDYPKFIKESQERREELAKTKADSLLTQALNQPRKSPFDK